MRAYPDRFTVVALAAHDNVGLLPEQAREFHPALVGATAEEPATHERLDTLLPKALCGPDALMAAAPLYSP